LSPRAPWFATTAQRTVASSPAGPGVHDDRRDRFVQRLQVGPLRGDDDHVGLLADAEAADRGVEVPGPHCLERDEAEHVALIELDVGDRFVSCHSVDVGA
jgi:hypothetical protein